MIPYLLKSTACLAILLVFYFLLLEKEKMHPFKRFYLLFSLLFAFGVPFIQIESSSIEAAPLVLLPPAAEVSGNGIFLPVNAPEIKDTTFLPMLIAFLYGLGVLVMGFRFVSNLMDLSTKITTNVRVSYKNARLVLINESILPYSFLQYIFVSKRDYESHRIENELFAHELAHVRQKHSLDVLFIKALQVVCWFNPLLYLYERAIKLNHEFLADDVAIKSCKDISTYQQLLLQRVLSGSKQQLSSNLNYSLTKTRLIMMTKNSSLISIIFKKAALIPLLAFLVLFFSTKSFAQGESDDKEAPTETATQPQDRTSRESDSLRQVKEIIYGNAKFMRKNEEGEMVKKRYEDLTEAEKEELPVPGPPKERVPTEDQLASWQDAREFGVWLDGKRIDNKLLENYEPSYFGIYYVSRLHKNAANYGKHTYQVDLSSRENFEEFRRSWLERLEGIK